MGQAACVIAVPMLGRPDAAQPLVDSLASSLADADARLLFIVSGDEPDVRAACTATGADVSAIEGPRRPGDYARKINLAAGLTREEWIFTAASDLVFHKGWLDEALKVAHGAPPSVVGTNDLGNPLVKRGRMSTHSLVHRQYLPYAVIDAPGKLYSEAYDHNYCDQELCDYARRRHRFIFARRSVVEHLHPSWRKGEMDSTYRVSLDAMRGDQSIFYERRLMWIHPGERYRMMQRRKLRSQR